MELKAGYKRTEVGIIPSDWECASLSQFLSFISYGFTNPMPTVQDGIFMVTAADINDGRLQLESARKTSESAYNTLLSAKSKPQTNDILLTKDGTLGRLAVVADETICINQSVAVLRPNKKVVPMFLKILLEAPLYQQRMIDDAGGSTIKHIYITIVDKMPIGLPLGKAEQHAIADVLSDVDALLGELDRIIAKKRDLKQAAMQQLLTGQTRLPGFGGKWSRAKADQIGRFRSGSGFPIIFQGARIGEYPVFKVSDMSNEGNETFMEMANNYIGEEQRRELGAIAFPARSIVFAKVGAAIFLERKRLLVKPSCLDNNMAAFVLDENVADYRFVHLVLLATRFGDLVSTTALPSLNASVLSAIEIPLPPMEEQTAIAAVLSDMEAEIAALEARRDKARALKQAMMQELLTGRTRLIEPDIKANQVATAQKGAA